MSNVLSVSKHASHTFSKQTASSIKLIAGEGVEGDAHRGTTVKHRSRVKVDPTQPNLRQVHLIHGELIEQLQQQGFDVQPGTLGENITTQGLDLLSLPTDTELQIGEQVRLKITGLRNPCKQLDNYQMGLTKAVLDRDSEGRLIRKAGIMAIVLQGGDVQPGSPIVVNLPPEPHHPLEKV